MLYILTGKVRTQMLGAIEYKCRKVLYYLRDRGISLSHSHTHTVCTQALYSQTVVVEELESCAEDLVSGCCRKSQSGEVDWQIDPDKAEG